MKIDEMIGEVQTAMKTSKSEAIEKMKAERKNAKAIRDKAYTDLCKLKDEFLEKVVSLLKTESPVFTEREALEDSTEEFCITIKVDKAANKKEKKNNSLPIWELFDKMMAKHQDVIKCGLQESAIEHEIGIMSRFMEPTSTLVFGFSETSNLVLRVKVRYNYRSYIKASEEEEFKMTIDVCSEDKKYEHALMGNLVPPFMIPPMMGM